MEEIIQHTLTQTPTQKGSKDTHIVIYVLKKSSFSPKTLTQTLARIYAPEVMCRCNCLCVCS